METTKAAELLFGRYRRQILALLLLRPDESFYVRELERLSGMRAGALHRELTVLTHAGLVRRLSRGNQVRYQANRQAPFFIELAAIFRKMSAGSGGGADPVLAAGEPEASYEVRPVARVPQTDSSSSLKRLNVQRRELVAVCKKWGISRMCLFGSATRADFRSDSDVDLLVDFPPGGWPSLFGIVDLRDELSALFGRPVDVVTPAALRNPYRKQSIERDLQVVYAAG